MSARVMTVTDAIAVSKGSALRDAVTITWVRSKTSSCAMQINGQLAGSSAAKRKSLTCQLLHALHARWGWSGATGKEETDVRYRRASQTVWHRPARAAHCVSRPVSRLASGSLSLRPHLPVLAAQWSVAVSGSLTVAWAAPELHSCGECAPASRFTPRALFAPQGHLRRVGLYAAVFRPASWRAPAREPAAAGSRERPLLRGSQV